MKNVCLHLNRPKKSFGATFVYQRLFEPPSYVLGRDRKSGHICHYSYVLGWGTKRPSISRNLASFCMFRKCYYFSTLNSSSRVTWCHFSKNVIFDPKKNFIGVLYIFVDIWSENVYLYPNRPNKVIYGHFFALMALWDSFVRIGPRQKKVDKYATIRKYWAEVLKDQQLMEI